MNDMNTTTVSRTICSSCGVGLHSTADFRARRCSDCRLVHSHTPLDRRVLRPLLRHWNHNVAEKTVQVRYGDLRHFVAFVSGSKTPPPPSPYADEHAASITALLLFEHPHPARVISHYIERKRESNQSSTLIRRLKTLRSWARQLDVIDDFPYNVDQPLESTPPKLYPKARDRRFVAQRDKILIDLLLHTPLERSQLLDLDWRDVDLGTDGDETTACIQPRCVPGQRQPHHLGRAATRSLKLWSSVYTARFGPPSPGRPVIPSLWDHPLSKTRLYRPPSPPQCSAPPATGFALSSTSLSSPS